MNPSAMVGHKGLTPALTDEINQALEAAELIKIKFNDHKEKEVKNALVEEIAQATRSQVAGMVGHVAILYRQHPDPEKRKIKLP